MTQRKFETIHEVMEDPKCAEIIRQTIQQIDNNRVTTAELGRILQKSHSAVVNYFQIYDDYGIQKLNQMVEHATASLLKPENKTIMIQI
jgi:hypothetical protein